MLDFGSRQKGKVIVLAVIVSLIVAWQTLRILEVGWRERKLLNQRFIVVQQRQAVFSLTSRILRQFSQSVQRDDLVNRLAADEVISYCLTQQGQLFNHCSSRFVDGIDVSALMQQENNPIADLSGDNWHYIRLITRADSQLQNITESVGFAVDQMTGDMWIQQRYWLQDP